MAQRVVYCGSVNCFIPSSLAYSTVKVNVVATSLTVSFFLKKFISFIMQNFWIWKRERKTHLINCSRLIQKKKRTNFCPLVNSIEEPFTLKWSDVNSNCTAKKKSQLATNNSTAGYESKNQKQIFPIVLWCDPQKIRHDGQIYNFRILLNQPHPPILIHRVGKFFRKTTRYIYPSSTALKFNVSFKLICHLIPHRASRNYRNYIVSDRKEQHFRTPTLPLNSFLEYLL